MLTLMGLAGAHGKGAELDGRMAEAIAAALTNRLFSDDTTATTTASGACPALPRCGYSSLSGVLH